MEDGRIFPYKAVMLQIPILMDKVRHTKML